MATDVLWKLDNQSLLLQKNDSRLASLKLFFEITLGQESFSITEAQEAAPDQSDDAIIRGKASIWGSEGTDIVFTYKKASGNVCQLQLTKPFTGFSELELPGVTITHWQQQLKIIVPEGDNTSMGQLTHNVLGMIKIDDSSLEIPFKIENPVWGYSFWIDFVFEVGGGPNLANLTALFGQEIHSNTDLSLLPSDLHTSMAKGIDVGAVRLLIDPTNSPKLVKAVVSFTLLEQKMWRIVPDLLAVGGLWVELEVDYPLETYRFPVFKIGGTVEIGATEGQNQGGHINIAARWPDLTIQGALAEGEVIHLGQILQHFGLVHDVIPALEIDQLRFAAEPTNTPTLFSFFIDVKNDAPNAWKIELTQDRYFQITEISLSLDYTGAHSQNPARINGRFYASLLIAGVGLYLVAEHNATIGWNFIANSITPIPIGDLIADLAEKFDTNLSLPAALTNLVVDHLSVAFTLKKEKKNPPDFHFTCEAKYPVDSGTADLTLTIAITHDGKAYNHEFGGSLTIETYKFALEFQETDTTTTKADLFIGALIEQKPVSLYTLVKAMTAGAVDLAPPLTLTLHDVLYAGLKHQTATSPEADKQPDGTGTSPSASLNKHLFALALDIDLNLTNLPLIGELFSNSNRDPAGISTLQIIYATDNITDQDVASLNQLIEAINNQPGNKPADPKLLPLPLNKPTTATTNTQTITALNKGFNVSGNLNLGIEQLPISTGGSQPAVGGVDQIQTPPSGNQGGAVSSQMTSPVSPPTGNAQWFAIQKQLGPLYFEKVGVRYEKGEIWFLLNADLSLAGLTIALDGLAVSSPLQKFDPRFHLQGLGIDYQDGPLEIGGMFLRQTYTDAKGKPYDEYDGIAILKTEELSLSAIGSYARLEGHPSLFVYAVLDYPLGGPSFFFVTGLSAGFGYNRFLNVPPVEQLLQFPLVSEAVSRAETAPPNSNTVPLPADSKRNLNNMKNTLAQEMEKLHQYISPQVDQYFLAVGVRFTSFEIIDSFVLVTLAFGGRFELNIIGLTSYATPPGAEEGTPSLVRVELAIKASFLPDEGFLGVRALLTNNSYLFDPACYLVGGMAFYSWFDGPHKGDFALTVGGYHPDFRVPAHYPLVPRLGFLWHYGNQLSIKGGMYFALTGHAIMAGGSLEAVWQDGDLQAWFKTTADFLLSWKPYYYEASVSVDIGGSLTIHAFGTHYITVHLHADLSVWGPKFSGVAHFQIIGIHFSISFGDKKSVPPAIEWPTFRQSFLPQTIYGITVQSGLVKSLKGYELDDKSELVQKAASTAVHWLLDPKNLSLTINSVIPIHSWQLNGKAATQFPHSVGVAPMNVRKEYFTSNFEITITNNDFTFEPITKPVPAGLWGNIYAPDVNDSSMVPDTVCGFQVSLKEQADEGIGHAIEKKKLSSNTEIIKDAYQWQPTWGKAGETMAKQTTSQQIKNGATDPAKQQALLQSLFSLDDTYHTGKLNASDLFAHPMLVEFKD